MSTECKLDFGCLVAFVVLAVLANHLTFFYTICVSRALEKPHSEILLHIAAELPARVGSQFGLLERRPRAAALGSQCSRYGKLYVYTYTHIYIYPFLGSLGIPRDQ